jgi:hypothetical protein
MAKNEIISHIEASLRHSIEEYDRLRADPSSYEGVPTEELETMDRNIAEMKQRHKHLLATTKQKSNG